MLKSLRRLVVCANNLKNELFFLIHTRFNTLYEFMRDFIYDLKLLLNYA